MTRNQIEYLKYKEAQRSNLKQEELTAARDQAAKELGFGNLAENVRHNTATERHNTLVLGEQQRHNYAQEAHDSAVLGEQIRSNRANEAMTKMRDAEVARANQAREAETLRHNQELESQGRVSLDLQQRSLSEVERSNRARETETNRSNLARESETHRANVAAESNRQQQIELGYSQLKEQERYHSMSISLGYSQLSEQQRTNRANEGIRMREVAERERTNLANEALIKARDKMNYEESVRSALAREEETNRHNVEMEIHAHDQNLLEQMRLDETRTHNEVMERQGALNTSADVISKGAKLLPLILG